jgi:hypothetical protein
MTTDNTNKNAAPADRREIKLVLTETVYGECSSTAHYSTVEISLPGDRPPTPQEEFTIESFIDSIWGLLGFGPDEPEYELENEEDEAERETAAAVRSPVEYWDKAAWLAEIEKKRARHASKNQR